MYRIIGSDQREYGPITSDQVRQWIRERRLTAGSLAQAEGTTDWKRLSEFGDFAAALSLQGHIAPLPAGPTLQAGSQNPMAVAGLVCGVLGILCCSCGPAFGVLAIVFSALALNQVKQNPAQGGKHLAIAGLILGVIAVLEFAGLLMFGAFGELLEKIK